MSYIYIVYGVIFDIDRCVFIFKIDTICTDAKGARDPITGIYYKCEYAENFRCIHSFYRVKCKKTCGQCGQGKNNIILTLSIFSCYNIFQIDEHHNHNSFFQT